MSLTELLPSICDLPRDEKVRLLRLLSVEVGDSHEPDDGIPPHLRHLMPLPGTVYDVWFPEPNPSAAAAAARALSEWKGG